MLWASPKSDKRGERTDSIRSVNENNRKYMIRIVDKAVREEWEVVFLIEIISECKGWYGLEKTNVR